MNFAGLKDTIWFNRSEAEDFEKCPRKAWWRYHYDGTGIEGTALKLDADIGTAIHLGIEELLHGRPIEVAVAVAIGSIRADIAAEQIEAELLTSNQRTERDEAVALVEAGVRGWGLCRLPKLLATGTVLAIEQEYNEIFSIPPGRPVGIQTRPDIVWRRSVDGSVFIRNIKTTNGANGTWREQWKIDMQTLSEPIAVEAALGEPVSGVRIEAVLKGRRVQYPQGSGNYYRNNPLLYGWRKEGEPPFTDDDWQWSYEWTDASGRHTLGRGYRKMPTWKHYPGGLAAWINKLWAEQPSLIEDQFIELPMILRSDFEIERWKRQTLQRQRSIATIAASIVDGSVRDGDRVLDEVFPMHTASGNCLRPGKCEYFKLCHESVTDPYQAGFKVRVPHHPTLVEEGGSLEEP